MSVARRGTLLFVTLPRFLKCQRRLAHVRHPHVSLPDSTLEMPHAGVAVALPDVDVGKPKACIAGRADVAVGHHVPASARAGLLKATTPIKKVSLIIVLQLRAAYDSRAKVELASAEAYMPLARRFHNRSGGAARARSKSCPTGFANQCTVCARKNYAITKQMDSLQDEVKAALRSTDRLKLRASSDRCGISTTTKTSTAQLRRNLQQWLEDVDGLVLPPRCSAVILRRAFCDGALLERRAGVRPARLRRHLRGHAVDVDFILAQAAARQRRAPVRPPLGAAELPLPGPQRVPRARRGAPRRVLGARPRHAVLLRARAPRRLPDRSTPRRAGTRASTSWATWRTPSSTRTRASAPPPPGVAFRFSWPTGSWSRRPTLLWCPRTRRRRGQSARRGGRRASPPPRPGWRTPSLQPLGRRRAGRRDAWCGRGNSTGAMATWSSISRRRCRWTASRRCTRKQSSATSSTRRRRVASRWRCRGPPRARSTTPSARGTCERRTWPSSTA